MSRSKYINTFNTTADYNNYIESAIPEFPNVGYDKEAGVVNIRRQSPNDYQIWGTTTATSNFNIKLNNTNVEVTVDPLLGEFYLTGWTGTLTSLRLFCYDLSHVTSIKKFSLDVSNVTDMTQMFQGSSVTSVNLATNYTTNVTGHASFIFKADTLLYLDISGWDLTNATIGSWEQMFGSNLKDIYITVEGTLMKLTNNLTSQGGLYIPSSATIHYDNGSQVIDYKWQNGAWRQQS